MFYVYCCIEIAMRKLKKNVYSETKFISFLAVTKLILNYFKPVLNEIVEIFLNDYSFETIIFEPVFKQYLF